VNTTNSDTPSHAGDYVLGTREDERHRLEFQHRVWLADAQRGWHAAGVAPGARVLDLGCGPGLATASMLEIVGPAGRVDGLDRSAEFVAQARARCGSAGRGDADVRQMNLVDEDVPTDMRGRYDVAWCRWLAMFVPQPERVIAAASAALRVGGRLVMHEYVDYSTYALHPRGGRVREFVALAIESFARDGGDAHIGRRLPAMLTAAGFTIDALRPMARAARPFEELWHWPAGFIRVYAPKLVEMGLADATWLENLLAEVDGAETRPGAFFTAPLLFEIVATKTLE